MAVARVGQGKFFDVDFRQVEFANSTSVTIVRVNVVPACV